MQKMALARSQLASGGRRKLIYAREPKDCLTNTYNPELLLLNRANMDMSIVGDTYAVIAYLLGYLTKEETDISQLLRKTNEECRKKPDIKEQLRKCEAIFDRHRECSIDEAAFRLLGLDMVCSSRMSKSIAALHPSKRDGLLKPQQNRNETDSNPTDDGAATDEGPNPTDDNAGNTGTHNSQQTGNGNEATGEGGSQPTEEKNEGTQNPAGSAATNSGNERVGEANLWVFAF